MAGIGFGESVGVMSIGILPSLARRCQLAHVMECHTVIACLDEEALRLKVVAAGYHFHATHRLWFIKVILDISRLLGAKHAILIAYDGARLMWMWQGRLCRDGKGGNVFIISLVAFCGLG